MPSIQINFTYKEIIKMPWSITKMAEKFKRGINSEVNRRYLNDLIIKYEN